MPAHFEVEPLTAVKDSLKTMDGAWGDAEALTFGDGTTWRPHLINGERLLAVHFEGELQPYLVRRLAAACASAYRITLAVPLGVLLDETFLVQVADLDVEIIVLRNGGCEKSKPLLRVLTDQGITVSGPTRTVLARGAYAANASDENPQSKGRRFEGLLGFLFGQTQGLRVQEYNLRTATEELDLVLQLNSLDGPRCWCQLGKPFILVEAKYWKDTVGQAVISAFQTKLAGKPLASALGIVVARSDFTEDAVTQVIRFSLANNSIVLIRGEQVEEWIESPDPDEYLESLIRRGLLA